MLGGRKKIPEKIKLLLWGKAAGRCQYRGCNKLLIGDNVSGNWTIESDYFAHIVAVSPGGPRGDLERSPLLAQDPANLMVLCDTHHRLIDRDDVDGHPESLLLGMKERHERRIEWLTGVKEEVETHVLLYGSKIGEHGCPLNFDDAVRAVLPARHPADNRSIDISLSNTRSSTDGEHEHWRSEVDNLRRAFATKVKERVDAGEVRHLSVFALAPMPLLIELGHLLSDIPAVDVHQFRREPKSWSWDKGGEPLVLRLTEPSAAGGPVALKIGISATITDERVEEVLGESSAIWSLEAEEPHNDAVRRREDVGQFRRLFHQALDKIKAVHGERAEIHLFPAMPASLAVEAGRARMKKADLPLIIYDKPQGDPRFVERHRVGFADGASR